jgi:hypothetical protein
MSLGGARQKQPIKQGTDVSEEQVVVSTVYQKCH